MAVIAVFGSASGYNSGIRIIVARMAPLNTNVAIIQYFDFVLILPPDSINESSNMGASLGKEGSPCLDTGVLFFVPGLPLWIKIPRKGYRKVLKPNAQRPGTVDRFTGLRWR